MTKKRASKKYLGVDYNAEYSDLDSIEQLDIKITDGDRSPRFWTSSYSFFFDPAISALIIERGFRQENIPLRDGIKDVPEAIRSWIIDHPLVDYTEMGGHMGGVTVEVLRDSQKYRNAISQDIHEGSK